MTNVLWLLAINIYDDYSPQCRNNHFYRNFFEITLNYKIKIYTVLLFNLIIVYFVAIRLLVLIILVFIVF